MKHGTFGFRGYGDALSHLGGLAVVLVLSCAPRLYAQEEQALEPTTTANPEISVAELEWRIKPMTVQQLEAEAGGWQLELQKIAQQISDENIQLLERKETRAAPDEAEVPNEDTNSPDAKAKAEVKDDRLEQLNALREQRTAVVDRARLVVDAFEEKGGDEKKVEAFRKYIDVTSGLKVDVSDTQAMWATAQGWVLSDEGGIRWLKNISVFVITLIAFYFLAKLLGAATERALTAAKGMSTLLRHFLVGAVRRVTLIIGIIVALAALEVNIGPLLAVIGAAGFVIAFALQSSLANFDSGILIMMFKPFDVGDAVDVAGVAGSVESVSLLTTHIKTFDNKEVIVPNNEVWGGVITNMTTTGIRRVDMLFGIGYNDDIDQAQRILEEIVAAQELVLTDPEPVIRMHELADSSVNFIVRPWARTSDYWTVYWAVQRAVKQRFDQEGISIPYPQRDVHVHNMT